MQADSDNARDNKRSQKECFALILIRQLFNHALRPDKETGETGPGMLDLEPPLCAPKTSSRGFHPDP